MPYYHATTKDRLESIRRHGIGGMPSAPKAFPNCQDGVYLASDPMFALSFLLERAMAGGFSHITPPEALAQFTVIVVDDSRVDARKLSKDPNIKQDGFWIYDGIVDVNAMPMLSAEEVTNTHFKLDPK